MMKVIIDSFKYFVFFILLQGCNEYSRETDFTSFESEVSLAGNEVAIPSFLQFPRRIISLDSVVVVQDRMNDKFFYILDKNNFKPIKGFGQNGKGPGEMISPWTVDTKDSEINFWVYDLTLKKFNGFNIGRIIKSDLKDSMNVILPEKIIDLVVDTARIYSPVFLNENKIVSPGFFANARLLHFDTLGKTSSSSGLFPAKEEDAIPSFIQGHAYQVNVSKNALAQKVVMGNRHSDLLEVYDFSGEFIKKIQGPVGFAPKYSVTNSNGSLMMLLDNKSKIGYIDISSSEHHIFALFSGLSQDDLPGQSHYGRTIFIFDWDGVPKYKITVPQFLIDIEYDEDLKCIYGIQEQPDPKIFRYDIQFVN